MYYAVWFRDHIHTDIDQKLAVFRTRKAAQKWMKKYGLPPCKVITLQTSIPVKDYPEENTNEQDAIHNCCRSL